MKIQKYIDVALKACTGVLLALSLVLTFTLSDYYIFNRIGEFNFFFVISQWIKKGGLLLFPLAVFYKKRCCADIVKYLLPVFVIVSMCTFGSFFDVTMMTEGITHEQKVQNVFASINEFMPKAANMTLFFIASILDLALCALLFVRDGYKVSAKSFIYLPFAIIAVIPLNIFENFFTINSSNLEEWKKSFFWFKNFTIWHFIALLALAGFTIGAYYFLKNKDQKLQNDYLIAGAIVLLIQYHSKDSILMGDGYNVYNTIFSALPLFICNIGVYVACLSVILRKRVLYSISFFVHAVGALTVFVYFGKDDMSNYGIICSYSILYFCLTHCLLFALCVLPSALGHYKFKPKDCLIPLLYYCIVIIIAAIASGLVTSFLTTYSYNGYTLTVGSAPTDDMTPPNFAFTQVNPLPINVFMVPIKIWNCELNLLYLLILYVAYVGLFWAFTGAHYAFLAIRKKILKPKTIPAVAIGSIKTAETDNAEIAATDIEKEKEEVD